MDLGVKDKAYAIVGGTGGMGLDTAKLLAAEGARVALVGLAEEIADLFAFVLSSRAGYLTGAVINCDGGTQS